MSIGKEWAKFTQRTREGFGGEKTEIPEEITEKKTKVEKIKKSMENFVSKTEVVVQPDPTKRVAGVFGAKDSAAKNPLFIFGQALMTTSNEYEGELSTLMRTFGESFTQIGELNNDLNHGIKEHFILPKVNFVKEDIKGALDEYDRLNSRRLEFDATKHKLKSAKEDKKPAIEQEITRTQAKFEESMSLAKAKLEHATDEEELQQSQKAQLMQMMYDLLEFHRKSYELLSSLDSQYHFLQNSSHTAKEKPDFNAIAVSDKLAAASISSPGAPSTPARGSIPPPVASKKRAKALYDFPMSQEGDLPLQAGDIVDLTDTNHPDWWSGSCNGRTGMFPRNYVELI